MASSSHDVDRTRLSVDSNASDNCTTRSRGSSITFDPRVTLDDGKVRPIDAPVAKTRTRERGRSILNELEASDATRMRARTHSESDTFGYDFVTGERLRPRPHPQHNHHNPRQPPPEDYEHHRRDPPYRQGESRYPLLQTTVDDLAREGPHEQRRRHGRDGGLEQIPSLTSASTISSGESEVPISPVDGPSNGVPISAPVQSPIADTMVDGRAVSPGPFTFAKSRSMTIQRTHSSRRILRNSSLRSSSSSLSPAGAFLSRWSREEHTQPVLEPDDEGQEIGDHSEYIIGRQIGYGGFSVVKEVFTLENDVKVRRAVKIVRKHVLGYSPQDNNRIQSDFEREVSIWRYLNHPHILRLLAVYDSPFATFCVTDITQGGTLFDLLRTRRRRNHHHSHRKSDESVKETPRPTSHGLPLPLARRFAYQLASAMRYLHQDIRIVHRDIKLENCLIDIPSPDINGNAGNLLLCDFGMADFISSDDRDERGGGEDDDADSTSDNESESNAELGSDADVLSTPSSQLSWSSRRPSLQASPTALRSPGLASAIPNLAQAQPTRRPKKLHNNHTAQATHITGTLQYQSPETINASHALYEPSADVWAFGVVCYALITGDLPFSHVFLPTVQMMVLRGEWDADAVRKAVRAATTTEAESNSSHASGMDFAKAEQDAEAEAEAEAEAALELLRGCLHMDPDLRWPILRVLRCRFLEPCAKLAANGV